MSFGFTPSFKEDLYFDNLTAQQIFVVAVEAAKKLEWRIDFLSETGFIAGTNRGSFKLNSEISFRLEEGKASIESKSVGSEMWDLGKNRKTIEKFRNVFVDLKYSKDAEELNREYELLRESFVTPQDDILSLPPPTRVEKTKNFFSLFIPQKGFFITPLIVDLNILIWLMMVFTGVSWINPDNESLFKWGANFRPMTIEGEYWRLLTNCFLHIGVVHLAMNLYALIYIGIMLEPILGKWKFSVAYLLTGIAASVASIWWNSAVISAGASGAIFGMYGLFLALLTSNLIEKTARTQLLSSIGIFVFYNLAYGMKGGIDNAAHLGGLVSGFIIGYGFLPSIKKPEDRNLGFISAGALAVFILFASFFVTRSLPNDFGIYDAKMNEFTANESKALEVFNMPENKTKEKLLFELKQNGIFYWKKNLILLDEVSKMDLPENIKKRNAKLTRYCELRVQSYQLIYKAVEEDTHVYDEEIRGMVDEISAIINDLSTKKE
ncbi:MAG: rhomboid family intramembrane serine protease [Bacteroidia bacterium]